MLAKTCTQPIELLDHDDKAVLIETGTSIQLPVYAIHHDERFHDAPNSFRPERFELQSVNELKKQSQFLPFGDGPRQCFGEKGKKNYIEFCFAQFYDAQFSILGKKLGMLQIKVGLVNILRHFTVTVNAKTIEPIVASPLDSLLTPINNIYLDFQRIVT